MASIMTNASAMTALQSLKQTTKALETTQKRISTGYRVSEAADNAAYWSIATTMRSDNKAISTVQDALGLGAATVDTAYTAMNSAISVVDDIKQKVLLAKTSSTEDRAKIQTEIAALQAQLSDSVGTSSYAGKNLLETDPSNGATLSLVSSYNRDSSGNVSTGTIDITLADTRLINSGGTKSGLLDTESTTTGTATATFSVLTLDVTTANLNDTDFDDMLTGVETALSGIEAGAASLGADKSRIDLQKDFISNLMDAIDRGIGQLVDADMNRESTKLQALQVQQQLGVQALSIANSNSQMILSLFR